VVNKECKCDRSCDGKWRLTGCTGTLHLDVSIRSSLSEQDRGKARGYELQHVNDYYIEKSGLEDDLEVKVHSLKRIPHADEASCLAAADEGLSPIIKRWYRDMDDEQYKKYDHFRGPHHH
jgi:hypothetical protein